MSREPTAAELDIGDVLHDAVRLQVAGDIRRASLMAIPAAKRNPILTASILAAKCAYAVHQYAAVLGIDPLAAYDLLWTKPERGAS